jgi:putative FmdB family regulatory protein
MPIFEFTCLACKHPRFSELIGVVAMNAAPKCPRCGSENISRLVSRFARVRSVDEALDEMAGMADTLDEDDPRAVRKLMKEMAHGLDDDISSDEIEAMMDESMASESLSESDS